MSLKFFQIYADIGAGKIGTTHGVKWLWDRFEQEANTTSSGHYHLTDTAPTSFKEAKHIDKLSRFFREDVVPQLTAELKQGGLPVVVSGDHSNAMATLSALCAANPTKRIGVLWIDAHCDLHTPFTTPSGNIHGMSLAAATRQDNLAYQSRQPDETIQQHWNTLKSLAPESQGIRPQDLCFLGLRSYESEEKGLLDHYQIPHFSVEKIHELGLDKVLAQVKSQFEAVDILYVTFDVDALDDRLIPATGTPEPQGFTEQEVAQILQAMLTMPNIAMFELTEFNPTLSADTECYERVYRLFKHAVALLEQA